MESALSFTVSERLRAPANPPERRGIQTRPELAMPRKSPSTKEEARACQIALVRMVASELKKDSPRHIEREIEIAEEAAVFVRGVWPKAEFLALLNAELFYKALLQFEVLESMKAVA
ncbi:MAG: hypothetical protein AB1657_02345 [Candidatus Micrarchaeota archaeon]